MDLTRLGEAKQITRSERGQCIKDVFRGVVMKLAIKLKLVREGHGWGWGEPKGPGKVT